MALVVFLVLLLSLVPPCLNVLFLVEVMIAYVVLISSSLPSIFLGWNKFILGEACLLLYVYMVIGDTLAFLFLNTLQV